MTIGYSSKDSWLDSQEGEEISSSLHSSDPSSAHKAVYFVDSGSHFSRINRSMHNADNSRLSSDEIYVRGGM
jgi:hypothetical protein